MLPIKRTFATAVLLAVATGCGSSRELPPFDAPIPIDTPSPEEVERVVFIMGDPGQGTVDTYPVLARLRDDIERWSAALPAASVSMVVLGDIVYPLGLHPPDHDRFPAESTIVASQVSLVAGPNARAKGAQAYLMAGNHDWGLEEDFEGYERLRNLEVLLNRLRAETGAAIYLVPEAGTGGPYVADVGEHLRILILDTAWWLLDVGGGSAGVEAAHQRVLERVEEAMRERGDREVMIAAHHPFRTAGPHGGRGSVWEALGLRYLLTRSGAILQDLTSVPYRELERGLRNIFDRVGAPLIFAGGHEHSLQIFQKVRPSDPQWSIVSGSGSKLSEIGRDEGMIFGASAPGYMRLVIERDGGMTLWVEAVEPTYHACPTADAEARTRCMSEGVAAFRMPYSVRIR